MNDFNLKDDDKKANSFCRSPTFGFGDAEFGYDKINKEKRDTIWCFVE